MKTKIATIILAIILVFTGRFPGSYIFDTSITVEAASKIATPKLVSVTKAKKGVTFTWKKVSGVTGYYVYRKTGNGSFKLLATVKGKTSYNDTKITLGKTYAYTVRAYKGKTASAFNNTGIKIRYVAISNSKNEELSGTATLLPGYHAEVLLGDDEPIALPEGYMNVDSAYVALNLFRSISNIWEWDENDKTQTHFNTNTSNMLPRLARDAQLEKTVQIRAKEIVTLWAHARPNGKTWDTAYPDYKALGENLAKGSAYYDAKTVTTAWAEEDCDYEHQGHRRNMLEKRFNAVGIACYVKDGKYYWVQCFGHKY